MGDPTNLASGANPAEEPTINMVPSYFVRVFLLLVGWCTAALTFNTPGSTTATLIANTGAVGKFWATVFCVTYLVLLADVVVNDFLPKRFKLPGARNYRWLFVSTMSLAYFIFAVLAMMLKNAPEGSWVLVVFYSAVGAFGLWFSAYAKFKRYERQMAAKNDEPQST